MTDTKAQSGLDGVVAAETRISDVNGLAGKLTIAGFSVEELASNASFEETVFLLWNDRLPDMTELTEFSLALGERRTIPEITVEVLKAAADRRVPAMDALRMAASTLSLESSVQNDSDALPHSDAMDIVSQFPTIVAAYWRLRNGEKLVAPRRDLSHAANFLYMLTGEVPGAQRARSLETYINSVVDHGLNASTFTARVIVSTQSDLVSAIVGAVGALKGPLHGGAPAPALDMVFAIGTEEHAEPYLRAALERGERLMGFGHRIYKVRDPRTDVLAVAAEQFYMTEGDRKLYDLALHVEATALRLLEEYKPGRRLQTNVEFYTALLLHGLGLPSDLFTATFAVGRVVGWIAHCFEQQKLNRLIRPQSVYVGEYDRKWLGVEHR